MADHSGPRASILSAATNCLWLLLLTHVTTKLNGGGVSATLTATLGSTTPRSNNTRALLYNTQRNIHANISELLDNLLRGYDNSVRPDFGGNVDEAP